MARAKRNGVALDGRLAPSGSARVIAHPEVERAAAEWRGNIAASINVLRNELGAAALTPAAKDTPRTMVDNWGRVCSGDTQVSITTFSQAARFAVLKAESLLDGVPKDECKAELKAIENLRDLSSKDTVRNLTVNRRTLQT